ncbi:hypothetical protein COS74_04615, partial [bacterium CG06_land_8_20_14_3_00_33_50]
MEVFIMAGTETHPMTSMMLAFKQAGFEVPNFGSKDLIRMKPRKTESASICKVTLIDDPLADILGTEIQEAVPAVDWEIIEVQKTAPAVDWVVIENSQTAPAVEKPKKQRKSKLKEKE